MELTTLKIKSYWPPILVSLSNKVYVMPGWIEVPIETTMAEIRKCWVDISPVPIKVIPPIEKSVLSSNGKKTYTVSYKNDQWTCNCVGFGFRRKCKHINEIKDDK